MNIVHTIAACRAALAACRREGKTIGFVPTMGYLHRGHAALVERSAAENGATAVSIFVNPIQFGPSEDYAAYPRDLERDAEICRRAGATLLFHPSAEEIYPAAQTVFVEETQRSLPLCGARRPGHFRGVATVVTKLLNIVQPDAAYFGQKDAQQAAVMESLVAELNLPLRLVICPTVREEDGLALSSRNTYLTAEERLIAPALYQGLKVVEASFLAGERRVGSLVHLGKEKILAAPKIKLEYFEILSYPALQVISTIDRRAVAALAARLGKCRLIDNIILPS